MDTQLSADIIEMVRLTPSVDKQFNVRIDKPLVADLNAIVKELKRRGFQTSVSALIRGATRRLADRFINELGLQKTPPSP